MNSGLACSFTTSTLLDRSAIGRPLVSAHEVVHDTSYLISSFPWTDIDTNGRIIHAKSHYSKAPKSWRSLPKDEPQYNGLSLRSWSIVQDCLNTIHTQQGFYSIYEISYWTFGSHLVQRTKNFLEKTQRYEWTHTDVFLNHMYGIIRALDLFLRSEYGLSVFWIETCKGAEDALVLFELDQRLRRKD